MEKHMAITFLFFYAQLPLWMSRTMQTNQTDRLALIYFRHSVDEDPLGALSSWNDSFHHCEWQGVICGGQHPERVVSLNLMSKGLGGLLSPHVGNLSFLRSLVLQNNSFRGEIPQSIGHLFRLRRLVLGKNSFGGQMPTNLSQCSNLEILYLIDNQLLGKIPDELGSLSKLQVLGLSRNSLAGSIPHSIGNLSQLCKLSLRKNGLQGVAYSKHIVHIYSYHGGDDIRNHLEIEAHVGSVNDLGFSCPNKQLCVVTCGDDWLIKVWDAMTGAKQHSFKGHEAPVYSVCPRCKENVQFIYSASTDGKIKAWFYDDGGPRVDYEAPGRSSVVMAFSADGTRLFSHGTNIEGESHLVEWDEGMWTIRRWYCGLRRLGGIGQFDISKNGFLAAGDECMVKFWDMDNINILTTTDAEGGLPASPCIRFNKEGTLLAVSKIDGDFKILANHDGIMLLRTVENWLF